jgi:hypothetical protein
MPKEVPAAVPSARKGGRAAFRPNEQQRQHVRRLKFVDKYTNETIAAILGISEPTLRKHFAWELEHSNAELLADVAGVLHDRAMKGDVTACIFILKTRAGWRETDRREITGADGAPLKMSGAPPLILVEYVDTPLSEPGETPRLPST